MPLKDKNYMNVTNLELSKKLFEIKFKAESWFSWGYENELTDRNNQPRLFDKTEIIVLSKYHKKEKYPAYDLETLLQFLPKVIDGRGLKIILDRSDRIGYELNAASNFNEIPINCFKLKNECLADTAARLLIKLREINLI